MLKRKFYLLFPISHIHLFKYHPIFNIDLHRSQAMIRRSRGAPAFLMNEIAQDPDLSETARAGDHHERLRAGSTNSSLLFGRSILVCTFDRCAASPVEYTRRCSRTSPPCWLEVASCSEHIAVSALPLGLQRRYGMQARHSP